MLGAQSLSSASLELRKRLENVVIYQAETKLERPAALALAIRVPNSDNMAVNHEPLTHDELILRDHLAIDRTRLANERTLLAYLRTSLMLLVAGATAVKLIDVNRSILITGWVFLLLGAITGVVGIWRFLAMRRAINRRDH
jgi:putative membrane protein